MAHVAADPALMDVSSEDTTSATERHVRNIPIHGGVNNWYIDVLEPPRSYRIDVGYFSRRGKFYVLARSNVVTTPKVGVADPLDENWLDVQKQIDRIENPASIGGSSNGNGHAAGVNLRDLFEERLRRPMNSVRAPAWRVWPRRGGPRLPLPDRRRVDRVRHHRAQCAGHAPG